MVWKPRVVVAAVLEKNGKYLVVEECVDGKNVINQPAGHLEANETILDAARREILEETGWIFEPTHLVGILHLLNPDTKRIFIRFTFTGKLVEQLPDYQLDPDIIATHWMSYEDIKSQEMLSWRSPLVIRSLDEYRAGVRYPLDIVHTLHVEPEKTACLNSSPENNLENASSWECQEELTPP